MVVPCGHGSAFKQGQTGSCVYQNGRIAAVIHTGKQTSRAVDRMRSGNFELTVGGQCLDRAALVGREAVDLCAISHKAANSGARLCLAYLDVNQCVRDHPTHDQHLLVHVGHDVGTLEA